MGAQAPLADYDATLTNKGKCRRINDASTGAINRYGDEARGRIKTEGPAIDRPRLIKNRCGISLEANFRFGVPVSQVEGVRLMLCL